MNLFEQLVIWLVRNKQTVTVTTGLMYGHKIIKLSNFDITELTDDKISIRSPSFHITVDNFDDLLKIIKAIED